jgi:tRNA(Ile)-lysidine synthetase-like protein
MTDSVLASAIATVPAGPWAVGVSGGADSVALLSLLRDRADLQLVVVHLDHETRGEASTGDAAFVAELAKSWRLPVVVALRSEIEPALANPPANTSALYRACRLELFRRVVNQRKLQGVLLAHHADDQAETVLHRLLRGSPANGLAGMSPRTNVGGLTILRPLLGVRRNQLRQELIDRRQPHREDASNTSDDYTRNRLRKFLATREPLTKALLDLASACAAMKDWVAQASPDLPDTFPVCKLADLPAPLARESARRWLIAQGSSPDDLASDVLDRLILMAADSATPGISQFPGKLLVRRRRGVVSAAGSHRIRDDGSPR